MLLSYKWVTARKKHRCESCGLLIGIGGDVIKINLTKEGFSSDARLCCSCGRIMPFYRMEKYIEEIIEFLEAKKNEQNAQKI